MVLFYGRQLNHNMIYTGFILDIVPTGYSMIMEKDFFLVLVKPSSNWEYDPTLPIDYNSLLYIGFSQKMIIISQIAQSPTSHEGTTLTVRHLRKRTKCQHLHAILNHR